MLILLRSAVRCYDRVDTRKDYGDTRKNLGMLGVFTLCYAYILAVLCVYQYSRGSTMIAIAVGILFLLAFLLLLFTFQTKHDYLGKKPFWFTIFWWVLITFGLFYLWVENDTIETGRAKGRFIA